MKFNTKVTSSRRKNRKAHFTAPAHERRIRMSSRLSKDLRKKYGFHSFPVRKNDKVTVISGAHKGKTGAVVGVRRSLYKVYVEGIKNTKSNGQERMIGIDASNLMITEFTLEYDRKEQLEKKKEHRLKCLSRIEHELK